LWRNTSDDDSLSHRVIILLSVLVVVEIVGKHWQVWAGHRVVAIPTLVPSTTPDK
jgi:hypothetical protein